MLIFPNPVSVYSCMVNTYTKIRALGICGGFNNHRWDLSRMCGRDCFDPDWNVVAAGVNHCSFILRGEYKGEDLYSSLLPRILTEDWKCPDNLTGKSTPILMRYALTSLCNLFRKHKTLIFSTESDGLDHVFIEHGRFTHDELIRRVSPFDPETRKQQSLAEIERRFAEFIELSKDPAQVPWSAPGKYESLIKVNYTDISIPILKALAGFEKMRIVASRPNRGAVAGLPDNAALEYTMDLYKDTVTPVENQYIPSPFKGLIASLSEFQTLQADAIAQGDPKLFAAALDAYPVNRLTPERKEFFKKMFEIYDDLDPIWKKSLDYIL
jgi:6-phospho-beta-glucosidase